jgi:hypothetical protein
MNYLGYRGRLVHLVAKGQDPDRYFWLMIEALYLTKPLYINIAGSFSYGNEEDGFLGRTPGRIPHKSNISLIHFSVMLMEKIYCNIARATLSRLEYIFPISLGSLIQEKLHRDLILS